MTALFWAAALLYAGAAFLFLGFLVGLPERTLPWARITLALGFLAQLAELGARGVAGLHPVTSVRETIGFVAWLIVGAFFIARGRRRIDPVGAIVAPAALALLLLARLGPAAEIDTAGLGAIGRVHILLSSAGVAIFAVAAATSVLYLLEERQLKRRQVGGIVRRGVDLNSLDRIATRCVEIGFPVFTLALIAGVVWGARRSLGLRPEHVIAGAAWTAFAVVLGARLAAGWRGRRAATLTVLGFAATLVVLGFYLVRAVV
jgi:ABC-type uncharacterized transport system permease subunit